MKLKKITLIFAAALAACSQAFAMDFVLVSHRGEPFRVPQNTKESIKLAYDLGAKVIECDFHATPYGQLLCGHDDKLFKKMSGIDKRLRDIKPEEVDKINMANSDEWRDKFKFVKLSTVDEILSVVPKGCVIECEIKHYSPEYADIFDAARKRAGLKVEQVRIIGGDGSQFENMKDFRKKYPEYQMLLIFSYNPKTKTPSAETIVARAKELGAEYISLGKYWEVDRQYIKTIQDAGIKVNIWQVQNLNDLLIAFKLKPDTITSDHARTLRDSLEAVKTLNLK